MYKRAIFIFYLSDIIEEVDEGKCVLLERNTRPPRLLICYSRNDGSAHVNVVLQLAAFLQKHMATQVSYIISKIHILITERMTEGFFKPRLVFGYS